MGTSEKLITVAKRARSRAIFFSFFYSASTLHPRACAPPHGSQPGPTMRDIAMVSPELVNVEDCGKTALVVVNRDQPVLIEHKQTQSGLIEHTVFLFFSFVLFQMTWYMDDTHELA